MRSDYEFVVAGCGGVGSAALYRLAREAGPDVLGLERFRLGHDNGGSQDHSRIIRLSYHDPAYTSLTPHTFAHWREVEEESGEQLVWRSGGLDLEPVGDEPRYINGYAGAMRAAGIPFEELPAEEVMARFPQFRLPENTRGLYQEDAGLVSAARANAAHVRLAKEHGATVLEDAPVTGVRTAGDGVEIDTPHGTFTARRLVVAAGSWTNDVVGHLGFTVPITVTREQVTYFGAPDLTAFEPGRFPVWIWHDGPDHSFYGLPVHGAPGVKIGQDVGGAPVDPDRRTFDPDPAYSERCRRFMREYIPSGLGPEVLTKTCLYDMTPDREFVLGEVPGCPQVVVFCGAAHAYKFAAFVGRMLADLAVRGETPFPIGAFDPNRPAITDPSFAPTFAM